ncbi:MAG TPA: hypothetical protein PLX33_03410 [Alphaproteobacteria bacterium]|mgnify:CR=1 FL=1|nr:hypothetical protein [Alphaproteobacteria bacterium]
MTIMESTGIIRRIVERDGVFRVSFPEHAGYFSIAPDTADAAALEQRLRSAADTGATITFRFDARLRITEIL